MDGLGAVFAKLESLFVRYKLIIARDCTRAHTATYSRGRREKKLDEQFPTYGLKLAFVHRCDKHDFRPEIIILV